MLFGLIWFLIIGAIAGFLAGKIMKGKGFGLLGNIAVGVVGAFVGGFLFRVIGLTSYGLISATVGAVVLVWVVGIIKKK